MTPSNDPAAQVAERIVNRLICSCEDGAGHLSPIKAEQYLVKTLRGLLRTARQQQREQDIQAIKDRCEAVADSALGPMKDHEMQDGRVRYRQLGLAFIDAITRAAEEGT